MKRNCIAVLVVVFLAAALCLTGCGNRVDLPNQDFSNNETKAPGAGNHTDESAEVEAMPEIFLTPDEFVSAIKGTEQSADENAVDKVNISNIAYFYVPAVSFPNFELLQIEVLAGRIVYYYVPTGTADQGFHYDTGIVVTYAREDDLTANNPLISLAEQVNIDLTEEGFLYESERNSITFAVGNSWMSIRVPDSMNEYGQLKAFCTATKITVAKEEELQQKFPEYYGLNTAKGLEVYVWQTAEDTYYCGVLSGTNRIKTPEEISALAANGATVEEMKIILSSYGISDESISDESISVLPCKQSISDYAYQIDDAYIQKITELFMVKG